MKITVTLIALALLINLSVEAQKKRVRLEGIIKDADSLKQATIFTFGNSEFVKDTVVIREGKFVFEGEIEHPCLAIINTDKIRGGLGVWLTSGDIKVTFYKQQYDSKLARLQSSSVVGSQETMDYLDQIILRNKISEEEKNSLKKNSSICNELEKYIKLHPDSYLSLFMLDNQMGECGIATTKRLFSLLSNQIQTSREGIRMVKEIEKVEHNSIGKTIVDFNMPDTVGNLIQLSSVVTGMTILHFWASWCGPCRYENRELVKYQKIFNEKSIKVIGVSLDNDKKDWLKAIQKDGMNWLQLSELKGGFESEISKKFKITSIPYILLIDKDLTIKAVDFQGIIKEIKR